MLDLKKDFEEDIAGRLLANPDAARQQIGAIFTFKIKGDGGGVWTLDCKKDLGVREGETGEAECTVECSVEDWRAMRADASIAMKLFMEGKLKLSGNAMLATKLTQVLRGPRKTEGTG